MTTVHTATRICGQSCNSNPENSLRASIRPVAACCRLSLRKRRSTPVTAAIDITTVPYYGDVEGMPMVSGLNSEERAFGFATLSIIGQNIPLVLAVEPVRESSSWDENSPDQIHRVVRRLVQRAKDHVPIETVLCDREFDSMRVFQTLSNLNVDYPIPKWITSSEQDVLARMDKDDQEVAVESASVHVEAESHPMRFLYVPSTSGEGTTVFVTNLRVGPDEAESFVDATVVGGKSRTSTRASEVISSRRHPRKAIACGCSTSCSRCCCTTSGGSRTTCRKRGSTARWTTRPC